MGDKLECSNQRAAVSRRLTALKRYIAEDDSAKVKAKVLELKSAFASYESVHERYHATLTDSAHIEASSENFDEVQDKYADTLTIVKSYLKAAEVLPVTPIPSTPPCPPVLRLPPAPQPQVFSGDPERYPMWKASFSTLVERPDLALSGEHKMFYLQKYTSGAAYEAIESLFLIPSTDSYDSAINILKERFGTSSLVTSAFRRRLEAWPKISAKDPKALQAFSDFFAAD